MSDLTIGQHQVNVGAEGDIMVIPQYVLLEVWGSIPETQQIVSELTYWKLAGPFIKQLSNSVACPTTRKINFDLSYQIKQNGAISASDLRARAERIQSENDGYYGFTTHSPVRRDFMLRISIVVSQYGYTEMVNVSKPILFWKFDGISNLNRYYDLYFGDKSEVTRLLGTQGLYLE